MKTNVFLHPGKREYRYILDQESTLQPVKKKRGRPKGTKKGQGKKKQQLEKKKKKRGRKGLFTIFDRGKKGYVQVDPDKKKCRIKKGSPAAVTAALNHGIELFSNKFIQNNVAENKNSVMRAYRHLTGPKTEEGLDRRLRTFIILENNPIKLQEIQVSHDLLNISENFLCTHSNIST